MIAIIDYGMGNLRSVQKAFERLNMKTKIVNDPKDLELADRIILPGVGHFERGIRNLNESGFTDAIKEAVVIKSKPLLGICLGMQLLTDYSEEGGMEGLRLIKGHTLRFPHLGLNVPHMGWNTLTKSKESRFNDGILPEDTVYFVHSYYAHCANPEDVLFRTEYGLIFDSAFQKDNIIGFQFHPEKSHRTGLTLLNNFIKL